VLERLRQVKKTVMAKCDYCGSTILFGGKRQDELRFCNANCSARGALIALSRQVPENVVDESVMRVHQGLCPMCGGSGPVDIHVHHKVWSAIFLTSWKSTPQISCRGCGVKSQLGDAALSLVLGWWGFPWGLVLTPVQVGRNVVGIFRSPDPAKPSAQLEKVIRMNIAGRAIRQTASAEGHPGTDCK
jgi:DNA-directed RNA polymerase subunit RPC12/RpoP